MRVRVRIGIRVRDRVRVRAMVRVLPCSCRMSQRGASGGSQDIVFHTPRVRVGAVGVRVGVRVWVRVKG